MSTVQEPHVNNSAPAPAAPPPKPAEPEKKADKADPTPLFWRMFSASCMAIAASLGIVLYFQITTSIAQLRADVTQVREQNVQLLPKSEFSRSQSQVNADLQTLQARNLTAMEIWTARVTEQERKIERLRTELKDQTDALQRENQSLRERLVVLENRNKVK